MHTDLVQHNGRERNGHTWSKQVSFECVSVVWDRADVPWFKSSGVMHRNSVVFYKWTCALFVHFYAILPVVLNAYTIPTPECLQPHIASFLGSALKPLLLGCSWQQVIIWTACRSLDSILCHPHAFPFSFQLPLDLSSWPCSCFWGIFPLFLSFAIWPLCLHIFTWLKRGYAMLISDHPSTLFKTSLFIFMWELYVHVCMLWSIYPLYAAHLHCSWTAAFGQCLRCLVFNTLYVCVCMCRDVCVYVCCIRQDDLERDKCFRKSIAVCSSVLVCMCVLLA